jgi:GNAT superfamily N-acetyltransferase
MTVTHVFSQIARTSMHLRPFDEERDRIMEATHPTWRQPAGLPTVRIVIPHNEKHWQEAGRMARELVEWIAGQTAIDRASVVEPMLRESHHLDVVYRPPLACFLMAMAVPNATAASMPGRVDIVASQAAGITAIRLIEPGVAELKRVWVRPEFRGQGIASLMLDHALEHARMMIAHTIRLETAPAIMPHAHAMYLARGFQPIQPYSGLAQHAPDVVAMELSLTP